MNNRETEQQFKAKLSIIAAHLPDYDVDDLHLLDQLTERHEILSSLVQTDFFPSVEKRGERFLVELATICEMHRLQYIATQLVNYCIDVGAIENDQRETSALLTKVISLISGFRFEAFVDIDRQAERLRLCTSSRSISLYPWILQSRDYMTILGMLHDRYRSTLTRIPTDPSHTDELEIEKYVNLIRMTQAFGKDNHQLLHSARWAKPYFFENLEYDHSYARTLFPDHQPLGPNLYDHLLCRNFNVLLFPAIGDVYVKDTAILVTNEGMGSILNPSIVISQEGSPPLEVMIQDEIAAGGIASFELNTMQQRHMLSMDPNLKQVNVTMRFSKYGRPYQLHQTIRTEQIIESLRNAVDPSTFSIKNSEELRNLIRTFFSSQIRHRVEQDDGNIVLTNPGQSERTLRSEDEIQATLKHWLGDLCRPYNIDINRESQTGRGPVDFKFSIGDTIKCVAEVKLWDSQKLKHGLELQLPTYLVSEQTLYGLYVVVAATPNSLSEKLAELQQLVDEHKRSSKFDIVIVEIQAWKRPSASKTAVYDDPSRYT